MEEVHQAITELTGALNAQIEQIKLLNNRMTNLERTMCQPSPRQSTPPVPRTESDLNDIRKLPDSVRDL